MVRHRKIKKPYRFEDLSHNPHFSRKGVRHGLVLDDVAVENLQKVLAAARMYRAFWIDGQTHPRLEFFLVRLPGADRFESYSEAKLRQRLGLSLN